MRKKGGTCLRIWRRENPKTGKKKRPGFFGRFWKRSGGIRPAVFLSGLLLLARSLFIHMTHLFLSLMGFFLLNFRPAQLFAADMQRQLF